MHTHPLPRQKYIIESTTEIINKRLLGTYCWWILWQGPCSIAELVPSRINSASGGAQYNNSNCNHHHALSAYYFQAMCQVHVLPLLYYCNIASFNPTQYYYYQQMRKEGLKEVKKFVQDLRASKF